MPNGGGGNGYRQEQPGVDRGEYLGAPGMGRGVKPDLALVAVRCTNPDRRVGRGEI